MFMPKAVCGFSPHLVFLLQKVLKQHMVTAAFQIKPPGCHALFVLIMVKGLHYASEGARITAAALALSCGLPGAGAKQGRLTQARENA